MLTVPLKMNLQQTCRLCLGQGGVLSPIFQESVGVVGGGEGCRPSAPQPQPTLPSRIMACATIKVVEGDLLPAQICHRCLYQVERSFDFKEQCENSDKVLRDYVAQIQDGPAIEGKVENTLFVKTNGTIVRLENMDSSRDEKAVDFSSNLDLSKHVRKEVKLNLLQAKISAMIHQTPVILPDEDVDSGLIESLADCEDLQVIGSEGEGMSMGEGKNPKYDKTDDDISDRSESSEDEIRLRCKMCKETFPDVDSLEVHEVAHDSKGPPFTCSLCEKSFDDRSILDAHWLVHTGENPLICPVCELICANEDSLDVHLETHPVSLPYTCATCDKSYTTRSDLKKHAAIHSSLRPFKCTLCPKEFVRSTNFNKHLKVHSGPKPFSCSECPKVFRTKGDLHRHEIIHTGQKPFSCTLCNLSFNRKDKLTRHERLHAAGKVFATNLYAKPEDVLKSNMLFNGEVAPIQEMATDLSMPSKKEAEIQAETMDFNDDESTMDTESDNQLQICEDPIDETTSDVQGEKSEGNLEKQNGVESMVISLDPFQMERMDASMKDTELPTNYPLSTVKAEYEKGEYSPNENDVEENIQENTKPYACEFCPKKFADKSYMKTHQLTHLGIRPHACSFCGKGFFRRRELLRHEAVHTGIKPFSCKTCNKAFARSDKLMRHERTHGEPKSFSCSQCPAVFSRKDELSRHSMCHTGERPHCCSQCFKSFFSRAELTRHEKTHAGLKPFKCDYCEQSFHRRDKLNRHARTHMTAPQSADTNVLGTVNLHDLLAAHCGQHFAAEVRVKEEKTEVADDVKVRVDGSIDARALARLNQNPDIHLIPLKQN